MSERVVPHTLSCRITEDKILAACILRPEIFEYLSDFGVDHFVSLPHQAVWAAMRKLQHDGEPIGVLSIADALEMGDLENGSHVSDVVNAAWLGLLVLSTHAYTEENLFDRDVAWLRTLHDRRCAL